MVETATPYTVGELAATLARLGGFGCPPLVAVAVSGGPDSLALMLLTDRWARARGGVAWGLTVDHGLRSGSATEARQVAAWLAARGIPHRVLTWIGDKPATGIQEAARHARYGLLRDWCLAAGCRDLLTAHHREDQIETYLIRKRAGSGPDGLAGMSALRDLGGCRVVRPLLAAPKACLAAFLDGEGQPFLSDPSNRDPRFERSRVRSASADGAAIAAEIRRFAEARIARESAQGELIAAGVALDPAGFAFLDRSVIRAAPTEMSQAVLARVAATIGGVFYPLRRERVARLHADMVGDHPASRTLGGCRFVPRGEEILVMREASAAQPPVELPPGSRLVWDHRFEVLLEPEARETVVVGCLGEAGVAELGRAARKNSAIPRLVHPVLPACRDRHGLLAVPHLGYRRDAEADRVRIALRPTNALTPLAFAVV